MTGLEGYSTSTSNGSDPSKPKALIVIALERLSNFHFATFEETGEILFYDNGVYVKGGETLIEREIESEFGEKATIHITREVVAHIRRRTYHKRSEFDTELNIINVQNGLYHVLEDRLEPHSPDYLSLIQKPVPYDVNAPTPKKIIRFLSQVTYPQELGTLIQLMAFTFWRDNSIEVITSLYGHGQNGKSVVFAILTALHGLASVSDVSLRAIASQRFALYGLLDKDCNLDAELTNIALEDTAIIKKLTGKQPIRVEDKYKSSFDAKLHVKLWVSANRIPATTEETDAWFRRIRIIGFPNKYEGKNADPDLAEKLTAPEELSGMFKTLMSVLRKILKNKKITGPDETVDERRQRYERAANPITAFIEESLQKDDVNYSNMIKKPVLFQAYEHFCEKYRLPKESIINFGKILKKHYDFEDDLVGTGNNRQRMWRHCALTEEYLLVVQNGRQETLEVN